MNELASKCAYILPQTPFHSPDRVELYKLVLRGDFVVPRGVVSPRATSLLYRVSHVTVM